MIAAIMTAFRSKIGQIVIISIVAILFLWFFREKLKIFFQSLRRTGKDLYVEGDGEVPPQWIKGQLTPLVLKLEKALRLDWTLFFGNNERCTIMKQLNSLNNNQLRALSNAYENYHSRLLSDDVKASFADGCYEFFTPDTHITLVKRLNDIGIR